MQQEYTGKNIKILSDTEAIRKYPGMYIGSVDNPNHLLFEIMDNAVDEHLAGYTNDIYITFHNNSHVLVKDHGRGIPCDKREDSKYRACEIIFLKNHSGGKFDQDVYASSGGLHGVGLVAVNALSSYLKVLINRDGYEFKMSFQAGELLSTEYEKSNNLQTSTSIEIIPDKSIFINHEFDIEKIKHRIKLFTCLNHNLKVHLKEPNNDEIHTIQNHDGIKCLLNEENLPTIFDNIFINTYNNNLEIEACLCWTKGSNEDKIYSFTNCVPQTEGGTHVKGFKSGIVKFFQGIKSIQDILKNKPLTWHEIKHGFRGVIAIKIFCPQFASQSKSKLVTQSVKKHTENLVNEHMCDLYKKDPNLFTNILNKIIRYIYDKNNQKEEKTFSALIGDGNLRDCNIEDRSEAELYIVEGESAAGSGKACREKNQAIFSLSGKILNIEKANKIKILDSKTINMIAEVIGFKIMHDRVDRQPELRFGKIIIMVDADIDGNHIKTLLMSLFFRFMPEIIEKNMLYIADTPLFRIHTKSGGTKYIKDEVALQKVIYSNICNKISIQNTSENRSLIHSISNSQIMENIYDCMMMDFYIKNQYSSFEDIVNNIDKWSEHVSGTSISAQSYLDKNQNIITEDFITMCKRTIGKSEFDKTLKTINTIFGIKFIDIYHAFKNVKNDITIQRFKGLGEMNAEELKLSCMDPKTRYLKQIKMLDAEKSSNMCLILMGNLIKGRKEMISGTCL